MTWSAPSNATLIRHYHVYAHDGSAPLITQSNRIASLAATSDYAGTGSYTFVDWAGNPDGTTEYRVTSVDFQGNESMVPVGPDTVPPTTTATPAAGDYSGSLSVALACVDDVACAVTYYCTGDACDPATAYASPLTVSATTTVRYFSTDASGSVEAVNTGVWTIQAQAGLVTPEPSGAVVGACRCDAAGRVGFDLVLAALFGAGLALRSRRC